ncbi:DUF3307 domain-containing protein [Levilactobacillus andaensis]|uniref:DUF3307 domain-containing protein n=1 Tax=Levilactobacillus andaensis TaxID=2799570 RepID=UPI00194541A0|nr:DUF3307 domain-containing protein [Levilactobacillus andaensis]
MTIIMMTYLTHLLVDFIFQRDTTVEIKSGKMSWQKTKCLLGHAVISNLVIGLALYFITWISQQFIYGGNHDAFNLLDYFLILLWISGFHFVLDAMKHPIQLWLKKHWFTKQSDVVTYALDQILHLFSIFLAITIILGSSRLAAAYTQLQTSLKGGNVIVILQGILILLILETKFSEYFIKKFLTGTGVIPTAETTSSNDDSPKYHLGGYIGNLERIMITIFFLSNSIPSISIVVAIKAVTRFKTLENNSDFAEYYLLGSILSLLLGCLFPLIVHQLFYA